MLSNYSFTVTIPKFKNVWTGYGDPGKYKKRQFGKCPLEFQKDFFAGLIGEAEMIIDVDRSLFGNETKWVVEKTPTDPYRYHMHGTFYEITVDKMAEIQQKWAEKIGFIHKKQIEDCIFIKKHENAGHWDEYLIKDQYDPNDSAIEYSEQDLADSFCGIYCFKGKNNLNIE